MIIYKKGDIIEHGGKRYRVTEVLDSEQPEKSPEEGFFDRWSDPNHCLKAVEQNGDALKYVKDQTEAICLKAVEQNGYALKYVKDQTEAICLKAVEQNGDALPYVKDQTEAICLKAVEQDGDALQYVKDRKTFKKILKKQTRSK